MGACPESRVEARGGRTVGRGPRRHERQRAPREDETGLRHAVHLGARVLHHVVPEETGEDDVGREAGAPPAESQKSLVRPVTGDAEVDHLERRAEEGLETPRDRLVLLHPAAEDERIAEDGDARHARDLLPVVGVSKPERVRPAVRLPRLVARDAGDVLSKRPAELRVDRDERSAWGWRAVALGERLREEKTQAGLWGPDNQTRR